MCVLQEAGTKSISKTCTMKSVCVGGWGRSGGLAHVRQTQRTRSPRPGWLWRRPSGSRSYANPARHTQVSVTPQTTLSHMVTPGPSGALGPARRGRRVRSRPAGGRPAAPPHVRAPEGPSMPHGRGPRASCSSVETARAPFGDGARPVVCLPGGFTALNCGGPVISAPAFQTF